MGHGRPRTTPESHAQRKRREAVEDQLLEKQGFRSLAEAARHANLDYATFMRVIRDGLRDNPRVRTIDGFRKLGILHLVRAS